MKRSPSFANYYVKFLGQFVSVYELTAPQFARESFRWSEDEAAVKRYKETRVMEDVIGLSYREAISQLPADERENGGWPYDED